MINSENVKYYDRILSHILEVATQQIDFEKMKELCDGDGDLALVIGQEFEKRGFASIAETKLEYSIILRRNGLASIFYKNGGFVAEYERQNPPKTKAEKLNDHFYMIVEKEGYIPDDDSEEEERLNNSLIRCGLVKKVNDWIMLEKEGEVLSISGDTVQDYIKRKSYNHPLLSPTTVNNTYNGPVIDRSKFNHSPVNNSSTSTTHAIGEEDTKHKKWKVIGSIIGALVISVATAVKMFL